MKKNVRVDHIFPCEWFHTKTLGHSLWNVVKPKPIYQPTIYQCFPIRLLGNIYDHTQAGLYSFVCSHKFYFTTYKFTLGQHSRVIPQYSAVAEITFRDFHYDI